MKIVGLKELIELALGTHDKNIHYVCKMDGSYNRKVSLCLIAGKDNKTVGLATYIDNDKKEYKYSNASYCDDWLSSDELHNYLLQNLSPLCKKEQFEEYSKIINETFDKK